MRRHFSEQALEQRNEVFLDAQKLGICTSYHSFLAYSFNETCSSDNGSDTASYDGSLACEMDGKRRSHISHGLIFGEQVTCLCRYQPTPDTRDFRNVGFRASFRERQLFRDYFVSVRYEKSEEDGER